MNDYLAEARKRIIFPLDVGEIDSALSLVRELSMHVGGFKIGFEFVTATYIRELAFEHEEAAFEHLKKRRKLFELIRGLEFWDGKFNDIPNTVGAASAILGQYGVNMFNVHASAGEEAIKAAVAQKGNSKVLGVMVLTSLEGECQSIFGDTPGDAVVRFAFLLKNAGADGIICSPQEALVLRGFYQLNHMLLVTPGVRPLWTSADDQKRVMTPADAMRAGVDYLVIGRPIRKPPAEIGSPIDAVDLIVVEMATALREKGEVL